MGRNAPYIGWNDIVSNTGALLFARSENSQFSSTNCAFSLCVIIDAAASSFNSIIALAENHAWLTTRAPFTLGCSRNVASIAVRLNFSRSESTITSSVPPPASQNSMSLSIPSLLEFSDTLAGHRLLLCRWRWEIWLCGRSYRLWFGRVALLYPHVNILLISGKF